ncbi:MAG: hypothetical protein PHN51_11905 [Candidatus Nanopelagicales bacterium]|nr:hypothetical protein [Candidatus Nanopelagicales bacterium]
MDHLTPVMTADGLHCVMVSEQGKVLVRITDWKRDEPLYRMGDKVSVDNSWMSSVSGTIETRVGNVIINGAAIYPILGTRIPFQEGHIPPSKLENLIALQAKEKEDFKENTKDIRVSEYLETMDRLWMFTQIAPLVSSATSVKMIRQAPGAKQLKKKLLDEHGDKLSDPATGAMILKELQKHDDAFLADDPIAKRLMSNKAKISRQKVFGMYGEANDFKTSLTSSPITASMSEGLDTSPDVFPKYLNDQRLASYSRGHSTQLSGYAYTILQRALSGVEIVDTPCDTKEGLVGIVEDTRGMVGKYIRLSNKWSLVTSDTEAASYKGKKVEMRSPMFCASEGFTLCYACLGDTYKGQKNALNNIAAQFSGELMGLFLKRMHTSGFKLTKIHAIDLVT